MNYFVRGGFPVSVTIAIVICSYFTNAQTVIRGPYLQSLTHYSIKVMWRTNSSTDSRVNYGTDPSNLSSTQSVTGSRTNHIVLINGLQPFTKYYYSVGNASQTLSGPDSNHYFVTAPIPGTVQPIRIWGIGDFGKANSGQYAVKNSYLNFTGNTHTDLWIWMGDCAYGEGTDNQYQQNVFNVYDKIFHYMPFYPTPGNHDYLSVCAIPCFSSPTGHSGPYFDIMEVPKFGEAGGLASGTEAMYSFDYGNMHFVSLNSELGSPIGSYDWTGAYSLNFNSSPMTDWLIADLQANTKPWVVVYFHQCPYTKGSHDSDDIWEIYMGAMRQNFNPIFESMGVDLVVAGHSHVYERSYLLNGHYGYSSSFNPNSHVVDGSSGNESRDEAYVKYVDGPNANHGTVYVVIGNSGSRESGADLDHPAMYYGDDGYGSIVIDVLGNRLEAKYLSSTGVVMDTFHIIKKSINITTTVEVFICNGESYFAQGAYQTASGNYFDTIVTPGQAPDTIINTKLTVKPALVINRTVNICPGESFFAGGAYQTGSGTYYDSLTAANNCDSVVVTNLLVDPVIHDSRDMSICSGDSILAGGSLQTLAGTYYDTLFCDSVIITNLTVNGTTQNISMDAGWNMISSYIHPHDPDMIEIFSGVMAEILLVKDNWGMAYIPALGINSIGEWKVVEGYKVKASQPTNLTIRCEQVDPTTTPIALPAGWSLISYLRISAKDIGLMLNSITDNLVIVKNNMGASYIPAFGINTIGNMVPGQGYRIKMNNADTLKYVANTKTSALISVQESRLPAYYQNTGNTGHNATVIIPIDREVQLQSGDEIGIYNQHNILAGAAVYEDRHLAITVWGDDPTTDEVDGMQTGDNFIYRIWRAASRVEFEAEVAYESGETAYQNDGVSVLKKLGIKPALSDNLPIRIYPNPTKNLLHIEYSQKKNESFQLVLFDVYGKEILRRESMTDAPQEGLMILDLSELASGLYICNFRSGNTGSTVKILKH